MTARPSLLTARDVGSRSEAVNEFTLGQDRKLIGERERGGGEGEGKKEKRERKRGKKESILRQTAVFSKTYMYCSQTNQPDHRQHTILSWNSSQAFISFVWH